MPMPRLTLTLMVADECSSSMQKAARKSLSEYRTSGAPFGATVDFSNLIDTIHFMQSSESDHIQLCDMALYPIRRYEATKDSRCEALYYRSARLMWDCKTTRDDDEGLGSKRHFPPRAYWLSVLNRPNAPKGGYSQPSLHCDRERP
jgi:hypothetical protein